MQIDRAREEILCKPLTPSDSRDWWFPGRIFNSLLVPGGRDFLY
jgi:hypothetical protein